MINQLESVSLLFDGDLADACCEILLKLELYSLNTATKLQVFMISSSDRRCSVAIGLYLIDSAKTSVTRSVITNLIWSCASVGLVISTIGYVGFIGLTYVGLMVEVIVLQITIFSKKKCQKFLKVIC